MPRTASLLAFCLLIATAGPIISAGEPPQSSEFWVAAEKLDVREQRVEIERLSRDAVEHLRQGDYQKVIDRYLEVLDIDPDDLSALNNLGVVYEKRPEWNGRAVQTWKQVLTLSEKRNDSKHSERARRHLQSLDQLEVE